MLLTNEREESGVVVWHDKECHMGEATAGLEVAKRVCKILLLPTVPNKYLHTWERD